MDIPDERLTASATVRKTLHEPARSPRWQHVRASFIAEKPRCAACALDVEHRPHSLNVHHIVPFNFVVRVGRPDLELDARNLITLCEGGEEHHLVLGHLRDWESYNARARTDAAPRRLPRPSERGDREARVVARRARDAPAALRAVVERREDGAARPPRRGVSAGALNTVPISLGKRSHRVSHALFVVCRDGELLAFQSVADAVAYLESPDVEDGEFILAYDDVGTRMSIGVAEPTKRRRFLGLESLVLTAVLIEPASLVGAATDELRRTLASHLALDEKTPLAELVEAALRRFGK